MKPKGSVSHKKIRSSAGRDVASSRELTHKTVVRQQIREVSEGKRQVAEWIWKNIKRVWEPVMVGVAIGLLVHYIPEWVKPSTAPIEKLIRREADLAGGVCPHPETELHEYGKLFADGAIVLDYGSNRLWQGRTAIVDRLKPLHFFTLQHRPLNIHLDGREASAESTTNFVQDKPTFVAGIGTEFWHFRKINGNWQIISFEYDLPGNP